MLLTNGPDFGDPDFWVFLGIIILIVTAISIWPK